MLIQETMKTTGRERGIERDAESPSLSLLNTRGAVGRFFQFGQSPASPVQEPTTSKCRLCAGATPLEQRDAEFLLKRL